MKNQIKIIALGLITTIFAFAPQEEAQIKFYNAYLSGIEKFWYEGIDQLKSPTSPSNEQKFQLALGHYGLLNSTMKDQDEETFDKYADQTIEEFEKLINEDYKAAECKALLSSIYGFKMGYSPWKGMFLGAKSGRLMEEAIKDNDQSPIVWKIHGGSKLYTPKMWGGSVEKAAESFEKAIALFESQGDTENNWMYLDSHAFLGIAYSKMDKKEEAKQILRKALEVEPDFGWVKYHLLPSLEK